MSGNWVWDTSETSVVFVFESWTHGLTTVELMFSRSAWDTKGPSVSHRFGQSPKCKLTFLKPDLRVEKSKNAALAFLNGRRSAHFAYRWRHRPTPRPLNPSTSHNNNNNNNGGLHACVHAAEDIEPIRAKYSAPLPLRWAKKDYGQPTSHPSVYHKQSLTGREGKKKL